MFSCGVILAIVLVVLGAWVFKSSSGSATKKKIFGVYSRPQGVVYAFKVVFFYIIVWIRRKRSRKGGDGGGYGVKSRTREEEMECPQKLSSHPKAIDAVYFNAADKHGNYLVIATARRPRGVINGFFYLRIPEIGILETPKMPDTLLFGEEDRFQAEGIEIQCQKPMKAWHLGYKGQMKLNGSKESRSFDVSLDALWTSTGRHFDFDTDMNSWALSRGIAKESWSREYFQNLKEAHQTHYEQMGKLRGTVRVGDKVYDINLDSMRDHSYGHKREWKLIHRYGLHMFHTEEGLSGNVGIVCQPITASQLELGYLSKKDGLVVPVSSVDLPLWQHGEDGTPPTDYAFSFVAGGDKYVVEVKVLESPEFYIGWEWETRVVERMAQFKINGVPGWGLAEWDYRNYGGRPIEYAQADPEWTKNLEKG